MKGQNTIGRLSFEWSDRDEQGCSSLFEFLQIDPAAAEMFDLQKGQSRIIENGGVIFICLSGRGELSIDLHTYSIERGVFCLMLPYTIFQPIDFSEDFHGLAIAVSLDFLGRLSLQPIASYYPVVQDNPCITLTEEQLRGIMEACDFVSRRLALSGRPFAQEIQDTLSNYLTMEIVSLYASFKAGEQSKLSRQDQIFRQFTLSLTKNIRTHRHIDFYAAEACLTPRHFSSVIKKKSGKSPTQWINERTVLLIKLMLVNSELSIQEISNELNFPNQSFFSKYFKAHTGMTPKAFRNENG